MSSSPSLVYDSTDNVSPEEATDAIVTALSTPLQEALDLGEIKVVEVKRKRTRAPAATATPRKRKIGGLQMYPAVPIPTFGEVLCQDTRIGTYHFISDVKKAVQILNHWRTQKAWVAIDLETSSGWRNVADMFWEPAKDGTDDKRPIIKTHRGFKLDGTRWREDDPYNSDAWTSTIFLMQCSVEDGVAVIFDMRTLMQDAEFMVACRQMLTTCFLIGQGKLFDETFLITQFGVYPNFQFDTAIAHRMVTAGSIKGSDMGSLVKKYRGISLDKGWQKQWLSLHPDSPIPLEAILYAAGDVLFLLDVARRIYQDLIDRDQVFVWEEMERPFMFWIARARQIGMRLDDDILETLSTGLQEVILGIREKLAKLMPGVNPNSGDQLGKWFTDNGTILGLTPGNRLATDEKTLAKVIVTTKKEVVREVASGILDLRKAQKIESTYADPLRVAHRNPITGHAHSQWNQNEAKTGRMSSSDPNLQNIPMKDPRYAVLRDAFVAPLPLEVVLTLDGQFLGLTDPSLAVAYNTPHLVATIINEIQGRIEQWPMQVITCDYSQFEVRLLADMSGEEKMLNIFDQSFALNEKLRFYCKQNGLVFRDLGGIKEGFDEFTKAVADGKTEKAQKYETTAKQWIKIEKEHAFIVQSLKQLKLLDFHTQTAAALFCDGDVTRVTKEQRTIAKTVNFGIPYGRGANGIAAGVKIDITKAQEILDQYFSIYRKVERWLNETKNLVESQGFTETPGGRKRFYPLQPLAKIYEELLVVRDDPDQAAMWKSWCDVWRTREPGFMAKKMYGRNLSAAKRAATNAPIQGGNADATKAATLLVGPRLYQLNPLCAITMWVHDELGSIAPSHLAEQAAEIQVDGMVEGAKLFVKRCPIEVSCAISDRWSK